MTESKRRISKPGAARRKTLKTLSGSALAGGLLDQLPGAWQRPVVNSAVLPAHAQSSVAEERVTFMIKDAGDNQRLLSIKYTILRESDAIYAVVFPSAAAAEVTAGGPRDADLLSAMFPPAFAQIPDLGPTTTPAPVLVLTEDLLLDFSNQRMEARGMLKLGYGPDRCDDFLVRILLTDDRANIRRMDGGGTSQCGTEYTLIAGRNPAGVDGGFNVAIPATGRPPAPTTPGPVMSGRIRLDVTDISLNEMATLSFTYNLVRHAATRQIDQLVFPTGTEVEITMHQPASQVLQALFPAALAQDNGSETPPALLLTEEVILSFTDDDLTDNGALMLSYNRELCTGAFTVTVTLFDNRQDIQSITGASDISQCGNVTITVAPNPGPDSGFGTRPPQPTAGPTAAATTTLAPGETPAVPGPRVTTPSPTTTLPDPARAGFKFLRQVRAGIQDVIIPINLGEDDAGNRLYTYNYEVDWGDGYYTFGHTGFAEHSYRAAGLYTITITGEFPAIQTYDPVTSAGRNGIGFMIEVQQWGYAMRWQTMAYAFRHSGIAAITATDVPDLSQVTDCNNMFYSTELATPDLSGWDVSNVTDMSLMFSDMANFNADISGWDTGRVTNFFATFANSPVFNQDIGRWDVSSATNMRAMFADAVGFDQNLGRWDISNVRVDAANNSQGMDDMFGGFGAGVPLSPQNYDAMLAGWGSLSRLQSGVTLDAPLAQYYSNAAETSRNRLMDTYSWTITDAGRISEPTAPPPLPPATLEMGVTFVQFQSDTEMVVEPAYVSGEPQQTLLEITLMRDGPATAFSVTLTINTGMSTASDGSDVQYNGGSADNIVVNFGATDETQTVALMISGGGRGEGDERLVYELSAVMTATTTMMAGAAAAEVRIGPMNTLTITIINTPVPTTQMPQMIEWMSTDAIILMEPVDTNTRHVEETIEITRSSGTSRPVRIRYATTNATLSRAGINRFQPMSAQDARIVFEDVEVDLSSLSADGGEGVFILPATKSEFRLHVFRDVVTEADETITFTLLEDAQQGQMGTYQLMGERNLEITIQDPDYLPTNPPAATTAPPGGTPLAPGAGYGPGRTFRWLWEGGDYQIIGRLVTNAPDGRALAYADSRPTSNILEHAYDVFARGGEALFRMNLLTRMYTDLQTGASQRLDDGFTNYSYQVGLPYFGPASLSFSFSMDSNGQGFESLTTAGWRLTNIRGSTLTSHAVPRIGNSPYLWYARGPYVTEGARVPDRYPDHYLWQWDITEPVMLSGGTTPSGGGTTYYLTGVFATTQTGGTISASDVFWHSYNVGTTLDTSGSGVIHRLSVNLHKVAGAGTFVDTDAWGFSYQSGNGFGKRAQAALSDLSYTLDAGRFNIGNGQPLDLRVQRPDNKHVGLLIQADGAVELRDENGDILLSGVTIDVSTEGPTITRFEGE